MSKSCLATLEPKRIVFAVRKVAVGEDPSKNVVVFGMTEKELSYYSKNWMRSPKQQTATGLARKRARGAWTYSFQSHQLRHYLSDFKESESVEGRSRLLEGLHLPQ